VGLIFGFHSVANLLEGFQKFLNGAMANCVAITEIHPHLVLDFGVKKVAFNQLFDEKGYQLDFMVVFAWVVLLFLDPLPEADQESVQVCLRELEGLDQSLHDTKCSSISFPILLKDQFNALVS
jgi:hypothetical protein